MRLSSQVAARPIACGNTVAVPERATPCSASFHQLYCGMPSRSIAGATSFICETFSSRVMRLTRSCTRTSNGRASFWYGGICAAAAASITRHTITMPSSRIRVVTPRARITPREGRETPPWRRITLTAADLVRRGRDHLTTRFHPGGRLRAGRDRGAGGRNGPPGRPAPSVRVAARLAARRAGPVPPFRRQYVHRPRMGRRARGPGAVRPDAARRASVGPRGQGRRRPRVDPDRPASRRFLPLAQPLTEHCVARSPWRGGAGDVVGEFTAACKSAGLRAGLYLSPWDRNASVYGDSPRYNDFYCDQLTELLTRYGPIAEGWFDGANGEGPNGRGPVD